jgi:hypothetical protein
MVQKETRDSFAPIDDTAREILGKLSVSNELPPNTRVLGGSNLVNCVHIQLTFAIDAWQTIVGEAEDLSERATSAMRQEFGLDDLPSTQQ